MRKAFFAIQYYYLYWIKHFFLGINSFGSKVSHEFLELSTSSWLGIIVSAYWGTSNEFLRKRRFFHFYAAVVVSCDRKEGHDVACHVMDGRNLQSEYMCTLSLLTGVVEFFLCTHKDFASGRCENIKI